MGQAPASGEGGLEAGRGLALLATLTLLVNPLFVVLAQSFMTDVPFLGVSTAALSLLVRGFERDSRQASAGGLLLALAATFVRQLGLVLFIGFALASLWRRCPGFRTEAGSGSWPATSWCYAGLRRGKDCD